MIRDDKLDSFKASLGKPAPPQELRPALLALWYLAKGDWHEAHRIAQGIPGRDGAWVHAHLHRVEGDRDNAAYWYRHACRPISSQPLQEEWDEIVSALLGASQRSQGH
jgi:hypothetical protein